MTGAPPCLPYGIAALLAVILATAAPAQTAYPTGGAPVPPARMERIDPAAVTRGPIPPAYDLSAWMPPIGNQGRQGSCAAFAIAWAARSLLWTRVTNGPTPGEPFSPAFLFNSLNAQGKVGRGPEGSGCWGMQLDEALEFGRNTGFVPESAMPYSPGAQDCVGQADGNTVALAERYRIAGYLRVPDLETLRQHVAGGLPVVFQMRVGGPFNRHRGPTTLDASRGVSDPVDSWHAMVVVGYDDTRDGGAVRIANSWGTGWGDHGYAWVRYDAFLREATYAGNLQAFVLNPAERAVPDREPAGDARKLIAAMEREDPCAVLTLDASGTAVRGFVSREDMLGRARGAGAMADGIDLVPWPGCELRQRFAAMVDAGARIDLWVDTVAQPASETAAILVHPGQQLAITARMSAALRYARMFYLQSNDRVKSLGTPQPDGRIATPQSCGEGPGDCGFLFDDTSLGDEYVLLVASDAQLDDPLLAGEAFADRGSYRQFLTRLADAIRTAPDRRFAVRFARINVRKRA